MHKINYFILILTLTLKFSESDNTNFSSNKKLGSQPRKSTNSDDLPPNKIQNLKIEEFKKRLISIYSKIPIRAKEVLKKYDIKDLVIDNPLTSIKKRASLNICSKFNWNNADSRWIKKFSTFKHHLCVIEQGGSGDCFFHSLAGSLRMSKFSKNVLREFNKDNPLFERFGSLAVSKGEYYTHEDLRKMAAASFVTYNPLDKGDEKNFDEDLFSERMLFFNLEDPNKHENIEERIKAKLYNELRKSKPIKVARKVYDLHAEVSGHHWGDAFDKSALEKILSITIILFRSKDTCLILGEYENKPTTKAYVLIYYINMCHYQSAGVVSIENPTQIKSGYLKEEFPQFLSAIAYMDTSFYL